jgi:pSer/pThr/pTyr-binding forkhead associated (FHA) protein
VSNGVLTISGADGLGSEIPLAGALEFGRDASADVTLNDAGISRRHFKVTADAEGATVEDLGSSNGTYVNGERVSGARRLAEGDAIQAGETVLTFAAGATAATQVLADDPDATEAVPAPPPPSPEPPPAQQAAAPPPPPGPAPAPAPPPDRAPPPNRAPIRPEPAAQPAAAADRDFFDTWNAPAIAAIILGPLSIALLVFTSGSSLYTSLPVAIAAIAAGTIGRNKVDRGASDRFRGLASAGRTFGIVGTILSAIVLIALIAIEQALDVSAESISELIDEVRTEIENR